MARLVRMQGMTLVRDKYCWGKQARHRHECNPLVLHGTSSVFLEDIRRDGVQSKLSIFSESELRRMELILGRMIPRPGFLPSCTTDPDVAIGFARQGPMTLFYLKEAIDSYMLVNPRSHNLGTKILDEALGRLNDFFGKHSPVVLLINTKGYSISEQSIQRFYRIYETPIESLSKPEAKIKDRFNNFITKPSKRGDSHSFSQYYDVIAKAQCQFVNRSCEWDFGGQFELSHRYRIIPPDHIKAGVFITNLYRK